MRGLTYAALGFPFQPRIYSTHRDENADRCSPRRAVELVRQYFSDISTAGLVLTGPNSDRGLASPTRY